jgi:GT2 family glycosyltransferase
VIFVDNASTDGSLAMAERSIGNNTRIRIIRNAKNLGFSAGNNVGYEHASGVYIVFLNNDIVVDSQWLRCLVGALECDETIGLAQSILLDIKGCRIQCAGWLHGDYFMSLYSIGKDRPCSTIFPVTFEVSVAAGAAMIIRRKLVEETGLFEAEIPFFYDDTLLSFKTWLQEKRVVTVSNSKVYHAGMAATNTIADPTYFIALNTAKATACLTFDIYYRFGDLAKAIFLFALSILNQSMHFLLDHRPSGVFAKARALQWMLKNFRTIWRNRIRHWENARISPNTLVDKFMRIRLANFFMYLLPPSLRAKYCEEVAKKYESKLIQSSSAR